MIYYLKFLGNLTLLSLSSDYGLFLPRQLCVFMWINFNLSFYCLFFCFLWECSVTRVMAAPIQSEHGFDHITLGISASQDECYINISWFFLRFWLQLWWNWNPKLLWCSSLGFEHLRRDLFFSIQNLEMRTNFIFPFWFTFSLSFQPFKSSTIISGLCSCKRLSHTESRLQALFLYGQ